MDWSRESKTPGVCGLRSEKELSKANVRTPAAPKCVLEEAEDFFTVVATGNIGTVRQFLKKHRRPDGRLDFDVNSVNFQNDNAMSVAVDKGNMEVVKCLAQIMSVTKNSILLKAVHKGNFDMVKGLCENLNADLDCEPDETDYPKFVTPLLAAAAEGHYEIVGYLLDRGHKIAEPHAPECLCKRVCKAVNDVLNWESSILYTYTAMSNPAYIPYVTADPIHYCFRLYNRLTTLSKTSSFRQNYDLLAAKVSRFVASLVFECRSSTEVELVLSQPYRTGAKVELPRVQMAIDFKLKEFISNPRVQLVVQQKFLGHFDDWSYLSTYSQIVIIVSRMFTVPMAYISFMVNPKSEKSKYYASPVNKMINALAMHLVFLGLLFMETRAPKPSEHKHHMSSGWSPFIFLYFCSFIGMIAYQVLASGFRRYLMNGWNVYDLIMVTAFSLFAAFSVSSWVHVSMTKLTCTERKQWNGFDPQLMAEGFLVVATLLAYLKTLFWLQASKVFGPLQVVLWRLAQRLAWFCLFGAVALLGFSLSLSTLYSYYSGMSYVNPETKDKSTQEESFTDTRSSFKIFFWGFFGQSSPSAADVVLDNENEHVFTQAVGYAGLGCFFVLMVLVFKSMLIVMAVKSTDEDVHQTWLYRRTQLFMYFIDSPLLPPPFNLLPHRYSAKDKCDLETAKTNRSSEEYMDLAKALVERYFSKELKCRRGSVSTRPQNTSDGIFQRSRCRSL